MPKKCIRLFVLASAIACFSCGDIINEKINTASDSNRFNVENERNNL